MYLAYSYSFRSNIAVPVLLVVRFDPINMDLGSILQTLQRLLEAFKQCLPARPRIQAPVGQLRIVGIGHRTGVIQNEKNDLTWCVLLCERGVRGRGVCLALEDRDIKRKNGGRGGRRETGERELNNEEEAAEEGAGHGGMEETDCGRGVTVRPAANVWNKLLQKLERNAREFVSRVA